MKAIIILDKDKEPIYIAKVTDLSVEDYLKIQKQVQETTYKREQLANWKEQHLAREIESLKAEIKVLKGE